jgi:hypothetical protein
MTWSVIYKDSIYYPYSTFAFFATFVKSVDDIIVTGIDPVPNSGVISHDGGAHWSSLPLKHPWSLGKLNDVIYIVDSVSLFRSSDNGVTWLLSATGIPEDNDVDCELAFDSCSANSILLSNMQADPGDPLGGGDGTDSSEHILVSANQGITWDTLFTSKFDSLSGAIECGRRAIYFSTRYNGIMRSLNFGKTWQSIGGPNSLPASYNLCAISDNILLAIDTDGSVWRTTNSGGSWVTASDQPTSYTFVPSQLFGSDTILACDSAVFHFSYFTTSACDDLSMDSQRIDGPDSAYFSIVSPLPKRATGYDSVAIEFHPDSAREYSATYTATIGGRTVTILLSVHSPKGRILAQSDSAVQFDTVQTCGSGSTNSALILSKSCGTWKILSTTIVGSDSLHFSISGTPPSALTGRDSVVLLFAADSSREYTAQLILRLEDGTTKTIGLQGFAAKSSLAVPNLGVTIKPQSYSASALGTIDIPLYLAGSLDQASSQSIGLQTLDIVLSMNTDLLTPLSANPSIPNIPQIPVQITGKNSATLPVTLPANFTFSDSTELLTLHCQAFLTDTMQTMIALQSAVFEAKNASACFTQSPTNGTSTFSLIARCEDSVLTGDLAHGLAFVVRSIVPNPTDGKLTINLSGNGPIWVLYDLYDLLGHSVMHGTLAGSANSLDVGSLGSGSYYLRMMSGGEVVSRRVVVRK